MTSMPTSIKFGSYVYTIHTSSEDWEKLGGGDGFVGRTVHTLHQILIRPGYHPNYTADTLLHEVRHVICVLVGIQGSDELSQERFISRTNYLCLQVLKDNPQLLDYLLDPE